MASLLLAIIYLAFISLGLPDSLLGAAWPVAHVQMGVSISYAGIVSMIIALGTIVSSLLSDRLTRRIGTGLVTAVSVLFTAVALFGFSVSNAFWMLCLWAIPYGLGAGAIDAALNNYVAIHYASRHMSWLHCFWGVGAAVSPYIMGQALANGNSWSSGYQTVSIIQIAITVLLFISLPLWKKQKTEISASSKAAPAMGLSKILRINGVKYVLLAFLGYCALETTTGLWASTYLVMGRGIAEETAARYASFFYLGITVGRFLSGFVANRFGDKKMIRLGICVLFAGLAALWIPLESPWLCLAGLVVIGLGCAPIYPSIIHATPDNFGIENSQAIVGVQMASAYVGSTFMPPLFGLIADYINVNFFPPFLVVFAFLMLFMTERLNRAVKKGA